MEKLKQIICWCIITVVLLNNIIPSLSCASSYEAATGDALTEAIRKGTEEKIKEMIVADVQNGDTNYTQTKQFLTEMKNYVYEFSSRADTLYENMYNNKTDGIVELKNWILGEEDGMNHGMEGYFEESYVDFLLKKILEVSDAANRNESLPFYASYFAQASYGTQSIIDTFYTLDGLIIEEEIENLAKEIDEQITIKPDEQVKNEIRRIEEKIRKKIESLTQNEEEELINYIKGIRTEIETGTFSDEVKEKIIEEMENLFYTDGEVDIYKTQWNLITWLSEPSDTTLDGVQTQVSNVDDPLNGKFVTGILDGALGIVLIPFKIVLIIPGAIINLILGGIGLIGGDGGNVTLERILFNNVEGEAKLTLVDINVFKNPEGTTEAIVSIRNSIAGFYISFRNLAIVLSLAVLIYIGIRMAINSTAEVKAKYKSMLVNWVIGFGLIFILHYIIVITLNANELLVRTIYDGTIEDWDFMRQLVVQIWQIPFTKSFASIIMYCSLLIMTCSFLLVYIKRMLTIAFLITIAPLISVTYSIDKIGNNRSEILDTWLREFFFNVLIQPFHCLIYLIFVKTAINLINQTDYLDFGAMIFAIILIFSIYLGEKIIKEIFGFSNSKSLAQKVAVIALATKTISNVRNIVALRGAANDMRVNKKLKSVPNKMPDGSNISMEGLAQYRVLAEKHRKGETSKQKTGNVQPKQTKRQIVQPAVKKRRHLKNAPRTAKKAMRWYRDILKVTTGYNFAKSTGRNIKQERMKKKVINMTNEDMLIAVAENFRQKHDKTMSNEDLAKMAETIHKTSMKDLHSLPEIYFKAHIEEMYKNNSKNGEDAMKKIKDTIIFGNDKNKQWKK